MLPDAFEQGIKDRLSALFESCVTLERRGDGDPKEGCRTGLLALYWGILVFAALLDAAVIVLAVGFLGDLWDPWLAVAVTCGGLLVTLTLSRGIYAHIQGLGR